jgi:SAM-dependent methyltransferase
MTQGIVDYGQVASGYARHRRAHPKVLRNLIETANLSADSKVLEVGCGTGNYVAAVEAAAGCACWGIDPSEKMRAAARVREDVHLQAGTAERLEHPDESFDLVFSVDVIHHVTNRPAYFREAFRVLRDGGRVCTVTDSEEIIRQRQPLAVYFPETVEADLLRYPSTADLRRWNEQAGFRQVADVVVEFLYSMTDISAYRDKAYSCLHLIPQDAHRRGVECMERDVTQGPIQGNSRYFLLWATKGIVARQHPKRKRDDQARHFTGMS